MLVITDGFVNHTDTEETTESWNTAVRKKKKAVTQHSKQQQSKPLHAC